MNINLFKKLSKKTVYDRENKLPVIRASICTGEQVAGFKDKNSGKFEEVMLIKNSGDLNNFLAAYGIKPEEIKKEY